MRSSSDTGGGEEACRDEQRPQSAALEAARRHGRRLSAACGVLFGSGPGPLLRRTRRFMARLDEQRLPVEEAVRRWLDAERPTARRLQRLARSVATLADPPSIAIVRLGAGGADRALSPARGFEEALRVYSRAAAAARALPGDADGATIREVLALATEEVVLFLRDGDALWPDSLARIALSLHDHPSVLFLFGDEEIVEEGTNRAIPLLKPGWSPDLFRSSFYTRWPVVVRRRAALAAAEGLECRGAAALYELLLRLHDAPGAVLHVPKILARRGTAPRIDARADDEAEGDAAMRRALAAWARERMPGASVGPGRIAGSWRLRRARSRRLAVSVVIPTRDGLHWLERCLPGVVEEAPLEILIVDNESRDPATLDHLASLERDGTARVLRFPGPFNFAAMMNEAARVARGEFLLFLNNDTEVVAKGSIDAMAEEADRPDVGAVGALLLYADEMIQHAGLVVGMGVVAGHLCKGMRVEGAPFFVSPLLPREVSAVDGACFLVRRELFLAHGGFDALHLPVSFADVDFCLRAREKGLRILYTPHACFRHHETRTRDPELDQREVAWMEKRWGDRLESDPFYHPALSLLGEIPRPRSVGRH